MLSLVLFLSFMDQINDLTVCHLYYFLVIINCLALVIGQQNV